MLPHFTPDTAPTGVIGARLVAELGALGHHVEVVTSLPWYTDHAVEPTWRGRLLRRERTAWGSITRVHPFPTGDKTNIPRRAVGFAAFCAATALVGAFGRRADVVLAMSPPLPMAATGWLVSRARRAPLVLNVQDVFPDVAVELGVLRGRRAIAAASWLERWSYRRAAAVTVLSEDMRTNLAAKTDPDRLVVIPNFVDVEQVVPGPRLNAYREEFGLGERTVVMYAGNVGMSQSVDLLLDAARSLREREDVVFVVNGGGSGLVALKAAAQGLDNVVFVPMQPFERLPEVLAAADLHVIPLRAGLARSSVPSKTYSVLAAGRAVLASVDRGSEVDRVVTGSGAGLCVAPEDPAAFTAAMEAMLSGGREDLAAMGSRGRSWVEETGSPLTVARRYASVLRQPCRTRGGRPPAREPG